jgi:hypothetical protein
LVIDTVVCLTLAKWETVSGRFGGYLKLYTQRPCAAVCSKHQTRAEKQRASRVICEWW